MYTKELRKLIIENRLARLSANGKENIKIRKKLERELQKYI